MSIPESTIIYNLFPLLAGRFADWTPHMERAAGMGFTWIFLNPVQEPGLSGSLYSIKDYFGYNPALVDGDEGAPEAGDQCRLAMDSASDLGLWMMTDLVINHCAIDSPLIREHPEWFARDRKGKVAHPWCMDGSKKVVWGDLALFDHEGTSDTEGLYDYITSVIDHLVGMGFRGFRCDAAYQIQPEIWTRIIEDTRDRHGEILFVAETLGCTHEQTLQSAGAGFDFVFNSSKWWDMTSPWLIDQYAETRLVAPSISFPESHDTIRLCEELKCNAGAMMRNYFFSACFSTGVMMPLGFEYGFRKRPHVVSTRPSDWEETRLDLTGFITDVNSMKARLPILNEEAPTEVVDTDNPDLLIMLKRSDTDGSSFLLVLNKDADNPIDLDEASPVEIMRASGQAEAVDPGGLAHEPSSPLVMELAPSGFLAFHARGNPV